MRIDCVISHDGRRWVLRGPSLSLRAPTLEELDARVRATLRGSGLLANSERAEVFMAFDNSTIPGWIRPYAQHYFNRIIEVEGDHE